jgi:hypothetical protein
MDDKALAHRLIERAAAVGVALTIDAEESERSALQVPRGCWRLRCRRDHRLRSIVAVMGRQPGPGAGYPGVTPRR